MPKKSLDLTISDYKEEMRRIESNLDKCTYVQSYFPDVKITVSGVSDNNVEFTAPNINENNYTHYIIKHKQFDLKLYMYLDIFYKNEELIRIMGNPSYKLADKHGIYNNHKFVGYEITFDKHHFTHDNIIQDINSNIVQFIQKEPNVKINSKNLDPKLKNILSFI